VSVVLYDALGPRPALGMPPVMLPTVGVVIPPVGVLTLYTGAIVVGVVLNVGGGGAVLIVVGGGVPTVLQIIHTQGINKDQYNKQRIVKPNT
jgi:hypothetical protein